jgi:hypothetical protein
VAGSGGGELDATTTALVIAADEGGSFLLTEIDMASGAIRVIDTGTGGISIDDPAPSTSSDAEALAVEHGMDLVLVDVTGDPATTNTEPTANWEYTTWSPDSLLLAAAGVDPDTLAVFDRQGNTVHSIEDEVRRGTPESETLLWSPDGAYLAYRTDRNSDGVKELSVLNLVTGDVTEVSGPGLGTDQIRYVGWSSVAAIDVGDLLGKEVRSIDVEIAALQGRTTKELVTAKLYSSFDDVTVICTFVITYELELDGSTRFIESRKVECRKVGDGDTNCVKTEARVAGE